MGNRLSGANSTFSNSFLCGLSANQEQTNKLMQFNIILHSNFIILTHVFQTGFSIRNALGRQF